MAILSLNKPFFRGLFPTHLHKKSNEAILHKVQKTLFLGRFFAQICPKKIFIENRASSHFGHCHFASLCQKSAKTNEPSREKLVMNERTNERTKVNL